MSSSGLKLLAVVSVCLCIGCGSASSARQSKPAEIRLSVTSNASLSFLPVYIAGPAGCFAREGIEVRLDEAPGSAKSMQALIGGSVEAAASDYLTLLNVTSQGQGVRAFVLLQKLPDLVAAVSPKASPPIRSLQDLKGRTVGVPSRGGAFHLLFEHMLQEHGMNPDDVSVVGVGAGMSLALSAERGVVDAILLGPLGMSYLQRRYPSLTILTDTRTPESMKTSLGVSEMAFNIMCAREDWLRANPQTARKLASAMQCGLSWIQDHTPQQIREALPESGRSPDAQSDFDAIEVARISFPLDGRMTPEAHDASVRLLTGRDSAKFKHQEPYTNEFLRP